MTAQAAERHRPDAEHAALRCSALGVSLEVTCGPGTPAGRLGRLLAPLGEPRDGPPVRTGDGARRRIRLRLSRADDGALVADDGTDQCGFGSDGALLDHVQWYLNAAVIDDLSARATGFHAAAVQRGGTTLLLPAASEAGKSTLAALLVRDGWTYLSDEAVELAADGTLVPYPKAITLDPGAQALFPEAAPEHADTASWYVDPGAWGARPAYRPAAPTVVALPQFLPGHEPTVGAVEPGAALLALASSVFVFRRDPERNLRALARLVRAVPVVRLTYGTAAGALTTVGRAVAGR